MERGQALRPPRLSVESYDGCSRLGKETHRTEEHIQIVHVRNRRRVREGNEGVLRTPMEENGEQSGDGGAVLPCAAECVDLGGLTGDRQILRRLASDPTGRETRERGLERRNLVIERRR